MEQDPSQQRAAAIATIAYLAAAGCFFTIAAQVTNGAAGYAVAGGLFALAGAQQFLLLGSPPPDCPTCRR